MTKFILHGGRTRESNTDNSSFFDEMTRGLTGKIKILLCYFAVEDDEVEKKYQEEIKQFGKNDNLEFEIADENKLENQLKNADIFYMRGGSTAKLLNSLRKTTNLDKLIEGKTIAGSSAGAYAICKYAFSNESFEFRDGFGFLNLKCFCHYEEKDKDYVQKLKEYKEDLPIITLPEYKWVVIYK